ncbi:MAG: integrase core domain-containing protein [Pseudomonadota bacterium]|nr:integrase core domain-containing protein [Pseudomonadota bacterium]
MNRSLDQVIEWRGKPQQNAYAERFNRTVRYEWLAQHHFDSIAEVQDFATKWMWSLDRDKIVEPVLLRKGLSLS